MNTGRPGVRYITGVIPGSIYDQTVITSVACDSNEIEFHATLPYSTIRDDIIRVTEHLKRFPGALIVGGSLASEPFFQAIRDMHPDYVGNIKLTKESKILVANGLFFFNHRENLGITATPQLLEPFKKFVTSGEMTDDVLCVGIAVHLLREMRRPKKQPIYR